MRQWLMAIICTVSPAAVLGCGDSASSPTPAPINVTVQSASASATDAWVDVTAHLHNTGGPGTYKVQFWGQSGSSGVQLLAEADPVTVAAGYDETVTYRVTAFHPFLAQMVVLGRNEGQAAERESARWQF